MPYGDCEGAAAAFSPIYDSTSIEWEKIRLRFHHDYGGLVAKSRDGTQVNQFQIAGKDPKFEVGEAKIDEETTIVSSPEVPNPVALRYAFPWSP